MGKKIELNVCCPDCGHLQKYYSYKSSSELKGQRRKKCNKCSRSFKPQDHKVKDLPEIKKKLVEEKNKKGKGFHKYTKKDKER